MNDAPTLEYDGLLYWYVNYSDPSEDRCCYCRELIPDADSDDFQVPLILWKNRGTTPLMARLHWECGQHLMGRGLLSLSS